MIQKAAFIRNKVRRTARSGMEQFMRNVKNIFSLKLGNMFYGRYLPTEYT